MQQTENGGPAGTSRPFPRLLLTVALFLLAARVGTGIYESRQGGKLEDLVKWMPVDRAAAAARETGKPVLYYFTADWCGPCKKMKREVFRDSGHAALINEFFVPVRIEDTDSGTRVERLREALEIKAFPTLVIVSADEERTLSERGYGGAGRTVQWLKESLKELK